MQCPSCHGNLTVVHHLGVDIDFCRSCGGSFFDKGELQEYLRESLVSTEIEEAEFVVDRQVMGFAHIHDRPRPCPCGGTLHPFNYAYDSNIILDRCDKCQGIWADGGEVRRLAQFTRSNDLYQLMGSAVMDHSKTMKKLSGYGDLSQCNAPNRLPMFSFLPFIIVPLEDETPRQRVPYVTVILMVLIAMGFAAARFLSLDSSSFFSNETHVLNYLNVLPALFLQPSISQLAVSLLFLWVFADNVEDRLGHALTLIYFLAIGLFGYALFRQFYPQQIPLQFGPVGAVAGMMGAYVVLYPKAIVKTFFGSRIYDVPAFFYLLFWAALQSLAIYFEHIPSGRIWLPQIAGFVGGMSLMVIFRFYVWENRDIVKLSRQTSY